MVNDDGTLGSVISTSPSTITIPANTSKIDLPKMNLSRVITQDKVYKFRLVEMSGNTKVGTLAEFKLDARTNAMKDTKLVGLKGNRPASSTGTVSFSVKSEDNIVKAYYLKKANSAATSSSSAPSNVSEFGDLKEAKYIQITNNKVVEAPILLTDETTYEDKTFDVYFILEDEYGNVSTSVLSEKALIPWEKDGATTLAPTIVDAKITDVATVNKLSDVQLTWKLAEGETIGSNKFTVVLYRDGKAIEEKTGIAVLSTTLDTFVSSPLTAGTYYFEVYGEGSGNKLPSATFKSNETTVSKLDAVNADNIKLDVDKYNNSVLTWDASTSPAEDVKGYNVDLYGYDISNKDYTNKVQLTSGSPVEDTKIEGISSMTDNVLYKAYVTTKATGDKLSVVDSDEVKSKEFFKVYTPAIEGIAGSDSATFKITSREVSGMTPTYRVKVFLYNTNDPDGLFDGKYKEVSKLTQDVTVKADGTFDVKGLQPGTKYVIRLYATVNGIEGVSGYSAEFDTRLAMPTIENKTVVADNVTTKVGEIAKTTNGISVDGKEYKTAEYPAELAEIKNIVDNLVVGDILTYTSDVVTVKLCALDTGSRVRALGTTIGNRDLYLEGGNFSQRITGNVGGNIIISGNNESLDITGLTSQKEIKINAGSTIKGATKVVIMANEGASPVNFMDKKIKINVSTDTTIDVSSNVTISATPSNNIILNSEDTNGLNIIVNGDGTDTNAQSGKLDITAKGNVTVTANSLAFSADITVNVTDGTVDLSGSNLSGAQNVTITNTTTGAKTIKVKTADITPFEIKTAIDIKEYNISDISKANSVLSKAVTGLYDVDPDKKAENLAKLNAYLSKFTTLYGTTYGGTTKYGAKILEAKGNIVTISLNKTVDDRGNQVSVNIEGLK